jgi:pimeloyl-ACP methyl ester carboxylesterase
MYITVDGNRVFYSNGNGETNPGQPSVVFLHGAGMDHSVWVLPARYFARHKFNVVSLDYPGHGRSAGTPLTSIEDLAAWVSSTLDVLSIDDAAIVGHSMGSLVAMAFAASFPTRTRSLALLGTSTPMPVADPLLDAAKANDHDAIDMANTWSHSSFGQMGGNDNPGICMTMSGQRLLEQSKDDVFFTDLSACNSFHQGAELAARITTPTLVIIGSGDKMTAPVSARQVAGLIQGSRTIELHPCGHSMLSEQPNAVLDALATIV